MSDENTTPASNDPTQGPDKDFLEYVLKQIVGKPEAVKIERKVDDLGVLITLIVDPADMPIVVGKGGQTAKSLRTLLRLVGSRNEERINLKILEPDGSEHRTKENDSEAKAESKESSAKKDAGSFDNVI